MNRTQVRAVLWLRWRLSRNQLARGGALAGVLSVVLVVAAITGSLGGLAGGVALGVLGLPQATPNQLLLAWDVLLGLFGLLWLFSLVNELQRAESIDLHRLLHLPVSLGGLFVLNYLASHLNLVFLLTAPFLLGTCLGLALSRGPLFLLLLPALSGFLLMITAWTYCVRGWLTTLMVNPRRRRAIVVGLTTGLILLMQLPNLLFSFRSQNHTPPAAASPPQTPAPTPKDHLPDGVRVAHRYVPLLWVGQSAADLARSSPWMALATTGFGLGLAALGLRRAYTQTIRFYRGETNGTVHNAPAPRSTRKPDVPGLLAWQLPGLPEESAVVALGTLRSMLRAPEVKMGLATSVAMLGFFALMIFGKRATPLPEGARPIVMSAAAIFAALGLIQFFLNQFGTDREGFRALVLTGAPRHRILLGKNVGFAPLFLAVGATAIALAAWVLHATPVLILTGFLQLLTVGVICSGLGNFVSIIAPFRVAPGSLKPTKLPLRATLVMILCHLTFPVAMIPVVLSGAVDWLSRFAGWEPPFPLTLPASAATLAAAALVYAWSLRPLGHLLLGREQEILRAVTAEVE